MGTNDLPHELRARGAIEQDFCARLHLAIVERVKHSANLLADGGAARLAHGQHVTATTTQVLGQPFDLCRLATALGAFKGDEKTHTLFWRRGTYPTCCDYS